MEYQEETYQNNKKILIVLSSIVVLVLILSFAMNKNNYQLLMSEELPDIEHQIDELVINEVMTSNKGAYPDNNGNLYDYVELYNGTNHDINLKGYSLSDCYTEVKWLFPFKTIKSKEYLVIYLSGTKDEGLYANFKLKNAGGETVILRDSNNKIIDRIKTVAVVKNSVMSRNSNANWVIQTKPTPGYANTTEGYELFQKSLVSNEEKGLIINEILPNNQGNFKDNLGNYSGYIEIINKSGKIINLKNYGLSNEESASFKWQFPDVSISNNEVLLVYTSNRNIKEGILHTSFKLNNNNGVIVLSNNQGKIINKVTYQNVPNGMAYIRTDSNYEIGSSISPGYQNDNSGITEYQQSIKTAKSLIINEVMSSNYKYLAQNGGKYYDWIELKNNSDETINLKDYYLTTSKDNMTMYQLPNKELKKDEYYIIIASGNTKLSNNSYQHSNFKISSIESLYITHKNEIIDSLFISEIPVGYSIGKGTNHGIYYYKTPTPKAKNGSGTYAISYTPTINQKSGVYNDIKNLKIELTGTGTIYYTLNGSTPTTSSKVYKGPITIKKTTVVKYMAKESGKLNSEIGTASYIINEKHTLPVMSLSVNTSNLNKLHSHAWTTGYEVPAYIEYFEEGKEGFSEASGLQLFGGSTRGHPKKSYELTFKKKYGNGALEYQVFDNRDFSSFENLVLRTGSQDEFQGRLKSLIRDLVVTDLVDEYTDVDVRAYKPTILYLNGKYWGIYFIREKIDENYIANNYNVNPTNSTIMRIDGEVKYGNRNKYNQLMNYIRTHSMGNNKYYQEVAKQLDIDNLIDYWIAQSFTTNNDIVKNCTFFSNPNVNDGKWKFVLYDMDFSMYHTGVNYFYFMTNPKGMQGYSSTTTELLRNLMKSKAFKKRFVERLSYNLKNTWKTENVNKKIDEITNKLQPEIKRNLQRWGNSYSDWQTQVKYLKSFAKSRQKIIKSQAKSYFNLSNSEYKNYFG